MTAGLDRKKHWYFSWVEDQTAAGGWVSGYRCQLRNNSQVDNRELLLKKAMLEKAHGSAAGPDTT